MVKGLSTLFYYISLYEFTLTIKSIQEIIEDVKDNELLELLEETAEKLSVRLEYDDLKKGEIDTHGGTFLLRGARHILIHKHLTVGEKVDILTDILSQMEIEGVTIAPELQRRLLKGAASSPA